MGTQEETRPLPEGCPFGHVEDAVAHGLAGTRDISPALHCALLSDCDHRVDCLERMSDLIETVKAAESGLAA